MRLSDIHQGTYMAVNFTDATNKAISAYLKAANVAEPVDEPSIHCTIVYSVVDVPIEPNHNCRDELVTPGDLEIWPTKNGSVLVLRLNSKYLHDRFNKSLAMGAVYDYDEYKPHITLSYNPGDFDLVNAPPVMFDLQFDCEYVETLVD